MLHRPCNHRFHSWLRLRSHRTSFRRRCKRKKRRQDRRTPNGYQINFSANCSWRLLAAVLLMVLNSPKVGALEPTWSWNGLGIEKIGWLKMLNASKRNCSLRRSVIVVVFMELKSKLTYFGPRRILRPALPKTSCEVGKAIADVFQKFKSCLGPLLGFPVMSQLSCSKTTILTASSLVLRHDAGKPVRTTLIPPICQPPSSLSMGADQLPPQCLWRPKGSSYNAEFTQLILASNTEGP